MRDPFESDFKDGVNWIWWVERRDGSLAGYQDRNNVNSGKKSKAMSRSKEQVAGWIIDGNEKGKGTTGEWRKMKKKKPLVKLCIQVTLIYCFIQQKQLK